MLTQIKLTNFKCFKQETTFPLSRFNLLTGVNGGGKSTLLQSLLLMRQSIEDDMYTTRLILNGSCVNLGSFDNVRNREIPAIAPIFFEFSSKNHSKNSIRYRFGNYQTMSLNADDMTILLLKVTKNGNVIFDKANSVLFDPVEKFLYKLEASEQRFIQFSRENLYFKFEEIHFISADRIGPQEFYQKKELPKFPNVGTKGELTVNLLDKMRDELVSETLCLGEDSRTLITQTEAWLGTILNPLKLEVQRLKTNILELVIGGNKPANVGFGYSNILPIIVSGLIAKPGEKLIIENPEIHLHPKAQSALIQFLVAVANTGVQVFVESHSDHVLDALRIAVLKKQLLPEEARVLFFTRSNEQSEVITPTLDQNGRLDQWPEDFFDVAVKNLATLAAIPRTRVKAPKAQIS